MSYEYVFGFRHTFFAIFCVTEKQTPQPFSLLECMNYGWWQVFTAMWFFSFTGQSDATLHSLLFVQWELHPEQEIYLRSSDHILRIMRSDNVLPLYFSTILSHHQSSLIPYILCTLAKLKMNSYVVKIYIVRVQILWLSTSRKIPPWLDILHGWRWMDDKWKMIGGR